MYVTYAHIRTVRIQSARAHHVRPHSVLPFSPLLWSLLLFLLFLAMPNSRVFENAFFFVRITSFEFSGYSDFVIL